MENLKFTIIISVLTSIVAAMMYSLLVYAYQKINNWKIYSFLSSKDKKWQHWDVANGKIADKPVNSFLGLDFMGNSTFKICWVENKSPDSKDDGDGYIYWNNLSNGKMSFFHYEHNYHNYRDVFYREINHQGICYDAIFVNATDMGTKYVMMRKK
jgi:hypothetical protein